MWKDTQMRLFVVTGYEEDTNDLTTTLTSMMKAAGMKAQVHVVQMQAEDAPRYTHLTSTDLFHAGPNESPDDSLSSAQLDSTTYTTLGEEAHDWLTTIAHKQEKALAEKASKREARESETSDAGLSTRSVARAGSINQVRKYDHRHGVDFTPWWEDTRKNTHCTLTFRCCSTQTRSQHLLPCNPPTVRNVDFELTGPPAWVVGVLCAADRLPGSHLDRHGGRARGRLDTQLAHACRCQRARAPHAVGPSDDELGYGGGPAGGEP